MTEPAYRRSTGSPRGVARRDELLDRVADELATNGLVEFSLRRAAVAAGTTHKVLLYHFAGADDLLIQAVLRLRRRRTQRGVDAALAEHPGASLSRRVRALWPVLVGEQSWVLDQAIGLALYNSEDYAELARSASAQYLPALAAICPPGWAPRRRQEVAALVLATLRGLLIEWRTTGDAQAVERGFSALDRALDAEEALDNK